MKKINGIYLPDDDTHFESHLANGKIYQGKGTYQFGKLSVAVNQVSTDNRKVALDIGAHVGTWSRVLSYLFDTVIAFEPNQANYDCLVENCRDRLNVVTYQSAVGSEECDMYVIT